MNNKEIEYIVNENANNLYKLIRTEINRKKFNLSGEYLNHSGINIFKTISFAVFQPNLGTLVKLNLKCENNYEKGTESKLTLYRINGATYKTQFWFMIFFIALTLLVALYQIFITENDIGYNMLMLPIFGLIYILIVELFAEFTIQSLNKKIEKILGNENVKYKKL